MNRDYSKDFASFEGKIWLNSASEGALPLVSAAALREAVEWKSKPYLLTLQKFVSTQKDLKGSIGRLVNLTAQDIILGNSASHGLHLLADGIPWTEGDEILLMQNDFPADILPWLGLERRGVVVRQLKPRLRVLEPEEVEENITPRTRLVCLPHVHTFSGMTLDVERIGALCRDKGILFVVNITQSVGTMPLDCACLAADAVVSAGYKWLCGPYGTGFAWIAPPLRERMEINRAYWPAVLSDTELQSEDIIKAREVKSARAFDVFGTANFFNFVPWRAAIDYWLEVGLDNVRTYHDLLIERFIARLDRGRYDFISPLKGKRRSSLIVVSHKDTRHNEKIRNALIEKGVYSAFWRGNLRFTPHVYNTPQEMDITAALLNELA